MSVGRLPGRVSPPPRRLRAFGPRVARLAEPALAPELRRHLPQLLALPNVNAVGIGRKFAKGRPTGDIGIVVHVNRKMDLPPGKAVPGYLGHGAGDPLVCDVVESGPSRMFALRSGHGVVGTSDQPGICGLTIAAGGRHFALTCAHVAVDVLAEEMSPMRWQASDGEVGAGHVLAFTSFHQPELSADGAVITLLSGVPVAPWRILGHSSGIIGYGSFRETDAAGYLYVARGETIHCGFPSWMRAGEAQMDGRFWTFRDFWSLQVLGGVARPGHSGALIVRSGIGGLVAMGFLFAGSEENGVQTVWVFPFERIWHSLGLGPIPL